MGFDQHAVIGSIQLLRRDQLVALFLEIAGNPFN
jgi:hypothetical protein